MVMYVWHYIFAEPIQWLFYAFFQPSKLRSSFKSLSFTERIAHCLRLYFPFVFLCYLLAILAKLSVSVVAPVLAQIIDHPLLAIIPSVVIFMVVGIIVSVIIDAPFGIAISFAMSIAASFTWPIILGICIGTSLAVTASYSTYYINTLLMVITALLSTGIRISVLSITVCFLEIIILIFLTHQSFKYITSGGDSGKKEDAQNVIKSITIAWFIFSSLLVIIIYGITSNILGIILTLPIIVGILGFILLRNEKRQGLFSIMLSTGVISSFIIAFIGTISILVTLNHFDIALPLATSYILVFFRPHIYAVDSFFMTSTYFRFKRKPSNIVVYLHQSALYWNELTYFPLPFLRRMLSISAEQDTKKTLQVVRFIIVERPMQINTARIVTIEIVLRYLEQVTHLEDIALVSGWLDENLPSSIKISVFKASAVEMFARLTDVSREATRARSLLSWHYRFQSLQTMITLLEDFPDEAFRNKEFNNRISNVIRLWLNVAKRDLEELETTSVKMAMVSNVYKAGAVLRPSDSLFVGRSDIAHQLNESLAEQQHRSTLLLYGERRMGKSSLLHQLPGILGTSYLPIFYDVQSPGLTSRVDVFLSELANGIQLEMRERGTKVKNLNFASFQDVSQIDDSTVYELFDRWFDNVEEELKKTNRTILICFDEYDKLEEAGRLGRLNIGLLLDWLHSTIQSRSSIAFLFCGLRTFDELGTNWVNHFANVQAIKVSFLQATEAPALITRPSSDFPSREIFGAEVIAEILRITRCHPFLLQAICSMLVNHLNTEGRMQAELLDVSSTVHTIIESWSAYFQDQWVRSNQQQQICMLLLAYMNTGNLHELVQYSGIDEKLVLKALQVLIQRDLVFVDKNVYRIAVPIWNEWINQNKLSTSMLEHPHNLILSTALIINESTIRRILFSKGSVSASAFPNLSPIFVYELLKTYIKEHVDINIEYQESAQELRLQPQVVDPVQKIYSQLKILMQMTRNTLVNEEFEQEVQKLFQIFSSSVDVGSTYQHLSKDFAVFRLHTQHIFENVHVPIPTPVLVSPYSDISEKSIDHIRHIFKDLGSGVRIAILLLFCDLDKLRQVKQVLIDTLRKVFAIDVVVINQDNFLNIVCAKEPVQMLRHLILSQVSLTAVDPYIITGATPVHFFFGREPQLREIADHISTTSYAIIGGRRIGKTSTVSCLHLSRLPARGFRTIYQDCSNISTYESFINNKVRNWQPEPPVNAPTTFGELFETPPDDSPLVLLLDEADKLVPGDRENGWRIFNTLRALINAKRIQVVLSGERTLREALRDSHSPLFNLANEMLLGPLDFQAVSELVIRPMKQLEIKVVDETAIVHYIYAFTSGHPNVVQRLCRRLIDQLNAQESRCITLSDVAAITDDPKFQEDDFLKTYWDAATSLERIITLALSQQTGTYRLEEIHSLVREQTSIQLGMKQTKEALDRLVDLRSLLKRSQAGYTFSVEAFPRILLNTTTGADLFPVLVEEYYELEQKR